MNKKCTKCKETLPLTSFKKTGRINSGRTAMCKKCTQDTHNKWCRKTHHKGYANARLKYKYGITLAEHNAILESQGGVCAICGEKEKRKGSNGSLCVDHCHSTNQVRGLLCHKCNVLLGLSGDDPDLLYRAISYLKG